MGAVKNGERQSNKVYRFVFVHFLLSNVGFDESFHLDHFSFNLCDVINLFMGFTYVCLLGM